MSWLQKQVQVKINKQDVIERQAFDHLVRDVILSIEGYETEIKKCGNKPNKQQFQRLRTKNIEAVGSMNCLGLSMDDFKNDKKALKMAINRIVPYYLKIRNSGNKVIEAKILPLLLYLVNAFKNNNYKMLPPPKMNNFNQFLVNSALKNYGSAQQEIKKEMEEITENYVQYHKKQQEMMKNSNTKNNMQIFDNIKYSNNDLKTTNLYNSVNNNDINYNIYNEIEEDNKRSMENKLFNHDANDFDFNDDNDSDVDVDMTQGNKIINGIPKSSFFTKNEIKKLKPGDFFDYKDSFYQYHRAQIKGTEPNNRFFIVYQYKDRNNTKLHSAEILFNESTNVMAKVCSITELKPNRFEDTKCNSIFYIRGDYFNENINKWFPVKVDQRTGGQIRFGVKIRNQLYQKWIHLNDTRLQKQKPNQNKNNNNNNNYNNNDNWNDNKGWEVQNDNNYDF